MFRVSARPKHRASAHLNHRFSASTRVALCPASTHDCFGRRSKRCPHAHFDALTLIEIVDVMRAAKGVENARGLRGKIVDVYASCEIDPACCCNELATDATITVLLDVPE